MTLSINSSVVIDFRIKNLQEYFTIYIHRELHVQFRFSKTFQKYEGKDTDTSQKI